MTDTANAPGCAFEFNTQGKAPSQKTKRIPPGLYTVSWKDGGTSEVAIGMTSNGDNWMAPTNWLRPAMIHSMEGDVWGSFERLERINATHCDELVAAAYVAASEKSWAIAVEMELHAAIGSTTKAKAEAIEGAILSGTPDNARTALTAYGERMKAEGARDAQAKIARLTEALNEKQDDGKNFWMKWTQKRLEINRAMFLRDAKLALAGDMRALRNRVELMEAEPVPIVLSSALQENADE